MDGLHGSRGGVDELALEYLRATEAGERPDLDRLTGQLDDPGARRELRALCETATWARSLFPAPFRPQLLVGGRYRLLEHLGSGGSGKVWRAHDEQLQRDVALKLFHAFLDADEVESNLARERQALAAVHHDGIVRLFDSGRHEDTQFLAMEHVPGRPLDRVVAELAARGDAAFPPDGAAVAAAVGGQAPPGTASLIEDDWFRTTANIAVAMLWALAAAHAHHIVHRDLKPGNVLLRAGARPLLLDFGLAGLQQTSGDLTGRLFGTAAYLAPEQLEAEHMGKDVRTDVYQTGLVLYEMLTLRSAFAGESCAALLSAVRTGRFAPPRRVRPRVPALLEDICLRALEADPGRRYPSADAFRCDLERWLAGAVPEASRLGRLGRVLRGGRGLFARRRSAALVAVALLAGVTVTALAMNRNPAVMVLSVSGDRLTVEVKGDAPLVLWEVSGAAGDAAVPRKVLVDGVEQPHYAVVLPPGTHEVRLGTDPLPDVRGGPRGTFRAVQAPPAEAADWERFGEEASRRAARRGRMLSKAELSDLALELQQSGRGGGAPLGTLSLDRIFR